MTPKQRTKSAVVQPPPESAQGSPEPHLTMPRFSALARLAIYPFCVLVPAAALTLGLLYFRQQDRDARIFGRICLGLGLLGLLCRMGRGGDFHAFQSAETLTQPYY